MTEFTLMPAVVTVNAVMDVVRSLGATTGTVDASNRQRIVVEFPVAGLGDAGYIAQSACRTFRDACLLPLTMDVNDERARFTLRDLAA